MIAYIPERITDQEDQFVYLSEFIESHERLEKSRWPQHISDEINSEIGRLFAYFTEDNRTEIFWNNNRVLIPERDAHIIGDMIKQKQEELDILEKMNTELERLLRRRIR